MLCIKVSFLFKGGVVVLKGGLCQNLTHSMGFFMLSVWEGGMSNISVRAV